MTETARALTYEELLFENARLHDDLAQLRRLIFGQKRERFVPLANAQQIAIALNDHAPAAASATPTTTITYTRRQKKSSTNKPPVRKPWPAHLRREIIRFEPKEDVTLLTKIGEEETEELEYVPPELYVKHHVRPKYAKPNGEGIVMADLPTRAIEKGSAGPGLIAHMIISKYVDHSAMRNHDCFDPIFRITCRSTGSCNSFVATKLRLPKARRVVG